MTDLAETGRRLSSLVRLEHSVFALPYAYVGAILAVDGWPGFLPLVWITIAMVSARTLAMALNRLIDAELDARNPRTAGRELPSGRLSRAAVVGLCIVSLVIFAVAVSQLAPLCRPLAPIAVLSFVIYPYTKRFTSLCHLFLGIVDGLAPVGAWIAVTNEAPWQAWVLGAVVACWIAGFDIIYATLDLDSDRANGIHSLPVSLGLAGALTVARLLHALAVVAMVVVGLSLGLGVAYYVGVVICAALLAYENAIVSPDDLSRVNAAFFNVNAIIAGIYLAAVAIDVAAGS